MNHIIDASLPDKKSVLQEYFGRYLRVVRGSSESTVKHYFDALKHISKRLRDMGMVQQDIYEIADLENLYLVRDHLNKDADFIALDTRGRRMYSAGLNNYLRFATGEDFSKIHAKVKELDVPVAPEAAIIVEQTVWRRSGILRTQAIEMADYACEMNAAHETFISESTDKPYMEGHHALPMNAQDHFNFSLDVYANIICLCPICHRKIHYGRKDDRIHMTLLIYEQRADRLANSGIIISEEDFVRVAAGL